MTDPSAGPASPDWATQVVDTLEGVIDTVRSKTTQPAMNVLRTLVFGLMAAGLGLAVLLLFTIGGVRVLDAYLPQGVWLAYVIIGGIFLITGLFLWSRRRAKP